MSDIETSADLDCTRCGTAGCVTASVEANDPWESANLCAACLRAYLTAIEPQADMPGAVRIGDGARLTRGDGYEVVDTRPTDITWEASDDDRPLTTISFAGMPEIRLADADADARGLARSIVDGSPDAVRGGAECIGFEGFEIDDGVLFVAEVDGEVLQEWLRVSVDDRRRACLDLFESGDIHDGLGPMADYEDYFEDGVYPSLAAYRRGEVRTFEEVLAIACDAEKVSVDKLAADMAAIDAESEEE